MNSNSSRQLLVWSVPTVAIVLSILWYRKRLRRLQTDSGGTEPSILEKEQLVALEQQQIEDAEELRLVQQEYKRLLAQGFKSEKVAQVKQLIPEISSEPKVAVKEVVEEQIVVVEKQQLEAVPELEPCALSPTKTMKAKVATAATAVEQITELTAKISVDVQQTQPQPRDSANTSPAEAMLASPTISHDSDTHSVVSSKFSCSLTQCVYHFQINEFSWP